MLAVTIFYVSISLRMSSVARTLKRACASNKVVVETKP